MDSDARVSRLEAQVEAIKEDVAELKTDVRDLHSRITTGNREIMDKLDQKFEAFGISEKQDHLRMSMDMDRVVKRVDVLERWRYMIVGAAIVAGWLLGQIEIKHLFH